MIRFETTKSGYLICPNPECHQVNSISLKYIVMKAVNLFERHPSGTGFFVGEERRLGDMDDMLFYCRICGHDWHVDETDEGIDLY